ncbi:MAG: 2-oxo acid dehydrogenase subunit E2 [Geobacter sp.]|nr:2-oxo acid dehydrogenase subunit E2 [Geobacter sp.]
MATEITMPKLSDTMTEGQLGAWRKSVGDKIERGDIIAEVETDKATMDLEAFTSGTLLEQRIQAGELVPVGTVIGLIGLPDEVAPGDAPPVKESAPEVPPVAVQEQSPAAAPDLPAPEHHPLPPSGLAAPIVRHRAAELGIDLADITGSGPGGRVLLDDLERQAKVEETPQEPPVMTTIDPVKIAEPASTRQNANFEPLNRMRAAIAKVTTESWRTIPHFYVSIDVEMGQAEKVVHDLKAEGIAVSLNSLILAAAAATLVKYPGLNATLTDKGILKFATVNLGFAVAIENGLLVPVIKGAENMGVRELNDEAGRLAAKSRTGNIAADEISGGTFSVSNLGMHGVSSLASIIMPGQSGILAVGALAERVLVRNGKLEVGKIMTATLSCDHRIIDGAYAAGFLNEFKRLLEHPSELPA